MSQPPAAHAAAAPALDTVLQTDAMGALISRFAGGAGAVSKLACVSAHTLTILRGANTKAAVERAQPADAFSHIVRDEEAMLLIFRYGGEEDALERLISKPVAGTVRVGVDGVEADSAAFEIDLTTGTVTFDSPPGAGAVVTAGFEFDVPVRFDADRIDVTLESFAAGRMAAVPLIEVRV